MRYILSILILAGVVSSGFCQPPDFTGIKIAIDPGHGGYESDDRGPFNGFWESESNLTKGLWLRDLLEARGAEVFMTRVLNLGDDSVDISLSARAAIANANDVDVFISIHSNAGNQSVNYPMTIFNGKTETPSIPAAKTWAIVLWEQLETNEATCFTHTGKYIGDLTLNPSWSSGYGVLYPLNVPGIISEGSFHDYLPEQSRLLNLDYRKQEAYNIFYAMITYFELEGTETFGNISGIIRDSLLIKEHYTNEFPDRYKNVNGAMVELLETGEVYQVDTLNTGFYMFDSLAPGDYHMVFSAQDHFNDTVEATVNAHQFTYINEWIEADKTMPPKMLKHSPEEGALTPCFDPVILTFSMNMDTASVAEAFSIEPSIPGSFLWDKYYLKGSFQPDYPYDTTTQYTVTLDSTAMQQWGVSMDTIHSFSFITENRNRYGIESSFPDSGQQMVSPHLQFRLVFDAPLKNTSLIDAVSIEGEEGSTRGTKGAEIQTVEGKGHYYFMPDTALNFDTDYTLILAGSIQDEESIPLGDTQRISFHTMQDPGVYTLMDEFDDISLWSIDLDESQGIDNQSFLYRWKREYLSGSASTLLRYMFLTPDASCVIRAVEPIALDPKLTHAGMWIWGEMSGQRISMGFDNGTETDLTIIDFAGWAYAIAEIPEDATALTYFNVIRENPDVEGGDLYFDLLHQPGSTVSIEHSELKGITAYPNPVVAGVLHLSGLPETVSSYRMYSVTGQLLQQGRIGPVSATVTLNDNVKGQPMFLLEVKGWKGTYRVLLTN
ncbi:MAG: N-acetylmuramoyl-L-alanine amidase [Bacteroidota bacterium]